MTTYDWADLRDKAIHAYGDAPGAQLEQRIIDTFDRHPAIVAALIDTVSAKVAAGKIGSGWAVLALECDRINTTATHTAVDTTDRTKAETRARQWMHAAGMHYDRWEEIDDELFGHTGQLRHWPDLAEHIHRLWLELRPIGERTEQEAIDRADQHKKAHPLGPPPADRPKPITLPPLQPVGITDPDDDLPL